MNVRADISLPGKEGLAGVHPDADPEWAAG
jgi:hypothetical protein